METPHLHDGYWERVFEFYPGYFRWTWPGRKDEATVYVEGASDVLPIQPPPKYLPTGPVTWPELKPMPPERHPPGTKYNL